MHEASTPNPPNSTRRLLMRHPHGVEAGDRPTLEAALRKAVARQQALAESCPLVRRVLDLDIDEKGYWLVEQPGEVTDVESLLAEAPLDESRVVTIGRELCDALLRTCYAGGTAQPHGGIRPACVFLADEQLRLSDFGIAQALSETLSPAAAREEIDLLAPYVAPELWLNPGSYGELRDLFAVGVLMYELATEKHPFGANRRDFNDCEHRILMGFNQSAKQHNPKLSAWFVEVLDRAVAKREEDRFPSLRSLYEALSNPGRHIEAPRQHAVMGPTGGEQGSATGGGTGGLSEAGDSVLTPSADHGGDLASAASEGGSLKSPTSRRGLMGVAAGAGVLAVVLLGWALTGAEKNNTDDTNDGACARFLAEAAKVKRVYESREHSRRAELSENVMQTIEGLYDACVQAEPAREEEVKSTREAARDFGRRLESYAVKLSEAERAADLPSRIGFLKDAKNAWESDYVAAQQGALEFIHESLDAADRALRRTELAEARKQWSQAKERAASAGLVASLAAHLDGMSDRLISALRKSFDQLEKTFEARDHATGESLAGALAAFLADVAVMDELVSNENTSRFSLARNWQQQLGTYRAALERTANARRLEDWQSAVNQAHNAWDTDHAKNLKAVIEGLDGPIRRAEEWFRRGDWQAAGALLDLARRGLSGADAPSQLSAVIDDLRTRWIEERMTALRPLIEQARTWLAEPGNTAPDDPFRHLAELDRAIGARAHLDGMDVLPPWTPSEAESAIEVTLDGLVPLAELDDEARGTIDALRRWTRVNLPLPGNESLSLLVVPGRGELVLPFWMGEYEITVNQYQAVIEALPTGERTQEVNPLMAGEPTNPVGFLDYDRATVFIELLEASFEGRVTVRMPFDDEWELALLAGSENVLHALPWNRKWTEADAPVLNPERMNFASEELREHDTLSYARVRDGYGLWAPVGSYPPNRWGFSDLLGNVREWVVNRATYDRVTMGGSFRESMDASLRNPTFRSKPTSLKLAYDDFGLRVLCLSLDPSPTTDAQPATGGGAGQTP